MNQKTAIITGGSKGIGNALVREYAEQGHKVFSIARSSDESLDPGKVSQVTFDLAHTEGIEDMFKGILKTITFKDISTITLINNAGSLGTISRLENIQPEVLQKVIALNFTAAMVLSSLFIKATAHLQVPKTIINISSGAAANPYYGWSSYCTTKAALDMLTKTTGLEQSGLEFGARVVSIYPGVVETAMQEQIRHSKEEDFRDVQKFIDLKEKGQLANPTDVAKKIFRLDGTGQFKNGEILDLRNF